MYSAEVPVDGTRVRAYATGDVVQRPQWQDTPNGRRPVAGSVALDEQGRPINLVGALLPIGRDGAKELVSVEVHSHEVIELEEFTPVEFVGLSMVVRPPKTGKGVEALFSAEAVRPAGASTAKPAPVRKSEDTAPKDAA